MPIHGRVSRAFRPAGARIAASSSTRTSSDGSLSWFMLSYRPGGHACPARNEARPRPAARRFHDGHATLAWLHANGLGQRNRNFRMARSFKIAGSILAGDFLNLGEAIRICEQAGADLLQLDVCDGHFVPTISFGEELVRRTCEVAKVPVEVHLMVSRPEDWVERMSGMGLFRMLRS